MDLISINEEDKLSALATALVSRERDLFHYKLNIDNYSLMLNALPTDDWPENIANYRGKDPSALVGIDMPTLALVSDYAYRDRLRHLIVTENIEMSKSRRVYEAIKAQIPAERLEELVAAAKEKMAQAQTSSPK